MRFTYNGRMGGAMIGLSVYRSILAAAVSAAVIGSAPDAVGATPSTRKPEGVFGAVRVSPAFFNPTLNQRQKIVVRVKKGGMLRGEVLDRDRYHVRTIEAHRVSPGTVTVEFDGKDDAGEVLPDEAYSLKLELAEGRSGESYQYDPSQGFVPQLEEPKTRTFSPVDGVLAYRLSRPARVHIQVGQAKFDPVTKRRDGPILKTLLDRVPRVEGEVVERWNGLDESGTIGVSRLPDLAVSIMAASLPEATMIMVGNRTETFLSYARRHRPKESLVPRDLKSAAGLHHAGLNVFEDGAPEVTLVETGSAIEATLSGFRTPFFLSQPNVVYVYVDERLFRKTEGDGPKVEIPLAGLPAGSHRVAVNWASKLGPVAVKALTVSVPAAGESTKNSNGGGAL